MWTQKNNLKKGDLVYFNESNTNELLLSPQNGAGERVKLQEVSINTDGKSFTDIKREIVSAYIRNVHVLHIEGKNLDKKVREIREYLSGLMALEIVEHSGNKIVAKDFLNMKKISLFQTIKKIDLIVRGMFEDSLKIFDVDSYQSLMVRDEDINRLVTMVLRVSRYALRKPHLIQNTGLAPFDFFKYFQIADSLERIADETKRLSRYLRKIEGEDALKQEIVDIYQDIYAQYTGVMDAFYANDFHKALELASQDHLLRERCDALSARHTQILSMPYLCTVAEKLKTLDYCVESIGREIYQ
jgi:phosphate uptake regulator